MGRRHSSCPNDVASRKAGGEIPPGTHSRGKEGPKVEAPLPQSPRPLLVHRKGLSLRISHSRCQGLTGASISQRVVLMQQLAERAVQHEPLNGLAAGDPGIAASDGSPGRHRTRAGVRHSSQSIGRYFWRVDASMQVPVIWRLTLDSLSPGKMLGRGY